MKTENNEDNYSRKNDKEFPKIQIKYLKAYSDLLNDILNNLDIDEKVNFLKKLIKYTNNRIDIFDLYIKNNFIFHLDKIENNSYFEEEKKILAQTNKIRLKIIEFLKSKGSKLNQLFTFYDELGGFLFNDIITDYYFYNIMDPQGFTYPEIRSICSRFRNLIQSKLEDFYTKIDSDESVSKAVKTVPKSPIVFAYYYAFLIHYGKLNAGKPLILKYEKNEELKSNTMYNYFYDKKYDFSRINNFENFVIEAMQKPFRAKKIYLAIELISERNEKFSLPDKLLEYIHL